MEEECYSSLIFAFYVPAPFLGGRGGGPGSVSHGDGRIGPNLPLTSSPTLGSMPDKEEA